MFLLLNCILLSIFILFTNASLNPYPTIFGVGLQGGIGTSIVISDDSSMIGAGFSTGEFKIFNQILTEVCSGVSTPG